MKIFYCLILLGFQLSCQEKYSQKKLVKIDLEKSMKNIKPLNICDFKCDINYLMLKNDSIKLKTIYLIDFSKELITVSDRAICLLYDSQGNYISQIGNRGKGPGEYVQISNIMIGCGEKIFIQSGKKIIVYNLEGKFIREFVPEIHDKTNNIRSLSIFQDSLFIGQIPNYSGKEKYKAVIFNNQGKTIKLFHNKVFLNRKSDNVNSFDSQATFYQFKGKSYFKEEMNDTLFLFNESNVVPTYIFNLGLYSQPRSDRELDPIKMAERIDNYIFIEDIFENSSYMFLDCGFNNHSPAKRSKPVIIHGIEDWYYTTKVLGLYDKESQMLWFSEPKKLDNRILNTGLYNDYDGGPSFYPKKMANDSTMAMWIDAYLVKEHVTSEAFKISTPKYPEKKKELVQLANSLDENDNPVLMMVKLKD